MKTKGKIKMNKQYQLQQGDVIGKQVAALPSTAKPRKADNRGYVIAEGEASNHQHVIEPQQDVNFYEDGKSLFVENKTDHDVVIKHEEHNPVKVPPGIFEFGIVQEFDYFAEAARQVRD